MKYSAKNAMHSQTSCGAKLWTSSCGMPAGLAAAVPVAASKPRLAATAL
jgi:hypothetical protein